MPHDSAFVREEAATDTKKEFPSKSGKVAIFEGDG